MDRIELREVLKTIKYQPWQAETPFQLKVFWMFLMIFAYTEIPIRVLLRARWGDVNWKKSLINARGRRIRKYRRHQKYHILPPILAKMRLFYLMIFDTLPKRKKMSEKLIWPYSRAHFYYHWAALKKVCNGEISDMKKVKSQQLVHLFIHNRPPENDVRIVGAGSINNV